MAKIVRVGNLELGGERIYVQSMLSTPAGDHDAALAQAIALEKAGCDILRLSIPNMESIETIRRLKKTVSMPIVADIHFDYRLAIASVEAGVDKIRINPGNIGSEEKVRAVVNACKTKNVPIRIGVNGGSLERELLERYGSPTPEAMVESAMRHVRILERLDFHDIVLSIKSSDVKKMIAAYRLLAKVCDYPFHLGVTEAGTKDMGVVKNAIGIGSLLADGIGSTIRVSLTADPVEEIHAGFRILKALDLVEGACQLVSCPTCGRTKIPVIEIAERVEKALEKNRSGLKVAVMGCAVNGPGEAREADVGIAGGNGEGLIFKKGKIVKKVPEDQLFDALMEEINEMSGNK
ncbi:MAG: flavodoxin-dependent (E)-4-hydroxy-3-methylbut-2-enyl-diphosphate synthase [Clostridia bacterium]|nr:flavodoxin-dependent (E)-4-hydroxy-3-methylbut-2-enyl-diphosphate synthase [Bacillota bacterium]MBQ7035463.1 flavodoxin-dependent (E)-4-hydroxy-3-methylbut-2-enyl-diphosphate synthase [Clostridia bacterium]